MRRLVIGAVVATSLIASGTARAATLTPFGHACTAQDGVRFCPTPPAAVGDDQRVPSFDGTLLDVDVTLPDRGDGPFPTIVMLHGFTYDKKAFEGTNSVGGPHYSTLWYASHGYAVVTHSVRGVAGSCGSADSRLITPSGCTNAEFELGDQRYDARDIQQLLGMLVDEGITDPKAMAATGISLGSLETLEVALLKNRVRNIDGSFSPWRSPKGTPLSLAAAYPQWAIGSLVDLAAPSGRFLDYEPATAINDRNPIGVVKLSFPVLAAAALQATTYSIPPGPDHANVTADLTYGALVPPDDARLMSILDGFGKYHQSVGIPMDGPSAPILMEDGWADSVVGGAVQALRTLDYLKTVAPGSDMSIQLADVGHGVSGNKAADTIALSDQALQFFDHHLKHQGAAPPKVTAYTLSCPLTAPSEGPYTAPTWADLHPGAVRFGGAATQTVSGPGDPSIGVQLDPIAPTNAHCPTFDATTMPGTASYTEKVQKTFTMLGLPAITLDVKADGNYGEIEGRLWDVAPGGQESFVTRGVYRLTNNQTGTITFQLFGGAHKFPAGHTVRLELVAAGAPTFRPTQGVVSMAVSNLSVELPTHEKPDGAQIVTPLHGGPMATTTCAQKRRTITIRVRGLRAVRVYYRGKRVRVRRGYVHFGVGRRPAARMKVTISSLSRRGKRVKRVRTYPLCVTARR